MPDRRPRAPAAWPHTPRRPLRGLAACGLLVLAGLGFGPVGLAPARVAPATVYAAQAPPADSAALPRLTAPVNDLAGVIDPASSSDLTRIINALQRQTGDVVIVATVDTMAPFATIQDYAVELFENHGAGIGARQQDNGALVVLAVKDRKVWIEVGYGLEGFITDGFAGETSRQYMAPLFRQGKYGEGLRAGVARLVGRIAQERGVTIENLPAAPAARPSSGSPGSIPFPLLLIVGFLLLQLFTRRRPPPGRRHWNGGPWSGWSGGVGPFGGSYGGWGSGGGGSGGGGFSGGGFGGFGGGRSGGGGGGAGW